MPKSHPTEFRAAEAERKTRGTYIYIIEHGSELFHLANFNEDIVVTGLPVAKGTDPQTFTKAQINHSAAEQRSEINANNVDLAIGINDSEWSAVLREMAIYTTPSTIRVSIIRVNSASLPGPIVYGTDTYTVFKGVATLLGMQAGSISLSLVSLIMQTDGKIPRYFRQKTCQHMLGGALCQVDLDDTAFHIVTTIDDLSLRGRSVDVLETTLDGNAITAETFQGGKLIETDFDDNTISILATELISGGVRLYLAWWSRTLAAAENIKIVRGCNRTLTQCETVFDNVANFGGQPWIPDISPSVHGL